MLRTTAICLGILFNIQFTPADENHPLVIRSLLDIVDFSAPDSPPPDSLAFQLGSACDVAEKFFKLDPQAMPHSDSLTDHSRNLPEGSPGRQHLAQLQKLETDYWRSQIIDARFAGDQLAVMFIIYVPRQTRDHKVAQAVYMIRTADTWRISFDIQTDTVVLLSEDALPSLHALQTASHNRLDELSGIVSQPLPFHGTWSTHYQQSNVYLSFNEHGEVFILQTHAGGSSSYGVCDFHLSDDVVVIETNVGSIRLRRDPDSYWEHDGRRYYGLITDDFKIWFPKYDKPLFLKPIYKDDWPVRRPILQ